MCLTAKKPEHKQKEYCKKFNADFKMVHIKKKKNLKKKEELRNVRASDPPGRLILPSCHPAKSLQSCLIVL